MFVAAEDNFAVLSYFFEEGRRQRCYIAPERFGGGGGGGGAALEAALAVGRVGDRAAEATLEELGGACVCARGRSCAR